MALFGKDKKEEKTTTPEEKVVEKKAEKTAQTETVSAKKEKQPFTVSKRKGRRQTTTTRYTDNLDKVLIRPRITEKATDVTASRTYVFEVAVHATKKDVENAVKEYYKVTPRKVNLVKIPRKKRMNRRTRKAGMSSLGKKAYVYLKDGDTIEFV